MGLIVEDLGCSRSGRAILRGIGLTLDDGETVLLRGPTGAGKSTLLRGLAGLLPVTARALSLDGQRLDTDPDAYTERLAYAGHADAIKPQLTVAENLRFWSALFGGSGVAPSLAAFGLTRLADRPAHLLSAGQKRRLGLARLLLVPRRLWLLDEPTVSLDTAATAQLAEALRAHAATGGMAVIAIHADLPLAATREMRIEPLAAAGTDPFLAGALG
jgi:heme exporter protein A